MPDRYLIDVDPRVFAIWDKSSVIALLATLGGEPADGFSAKKPVSGFQWSKTFNIIHTVLKMHWSPAVYSGEISVNIANIHFAEMM